MATNQKKLNSLMDEYLRTKDSLNEKELALLEYTLWEAAKETFDGPAPERQRWFRERFGGHNHSYDQRSRVLSFGDWADPLWERVLHQNMAVATATKLGQKAKTLSEDKGLSNTEALSMVFEDYEHSGYLVTNANGKKYRRTRPKARVRKPQKNLTGFLDFDVDNTRKFTTTMRAMVSQFIEGRLEGIAPSIKNELVTNFYYCLRILQEDLMRDIKRLRGVQKKLSEPEKPSFYRFKRACEVLGVSVPSPIKLPNLRNLKKRYWSRAARFHPDRNNGDEQYVKQYHAVNKAWEIIKSYY